MLPVWTLRSSLRVGVYVWVSPWGDFLDDEKIEAMEPPTTADWKNTAWTEWRKQNTKSLGAKNASKCNFLKLQGEVFGGLPFFSVRYTINSLNLKMMVWKMTFRIPGVYSQVPC